MKTLLVIMTALIGLTAKAQVGQYPGTPAPKTSIYCVESEALPDRDLVYFAEIKTQTGRAADFIVVGQWDQNQNRTELINQLIVDEKGSIEQGFVLKFISKLASGNLSYLRINYASGSKKLNYLPSVLVVKENGKSVAVPMTCTHMDQKSNKK